MLKTLDRYLLRNFLQSLFVVLLAVGLTFIVVNMVEQLQDFVDHKVPFLSILEYYLYFGGWVIYRFFPLFVLLAALFSISILARRREILAMKASGLSLYRIGAPIIVMSVLLSVGHFYYSEYLFPPANQRRLELKEYTIENRARTAAAITRDVRRQINPNDFYTIAMFNSDRKEGQDFKLYRTKSNQLAEFVSAGRVSYQDNRWVLHTGIVRTFVDTLETAYQKFDSLVVPDIEDRPEELAQRLGDPADMGLEDLKRYIALMKRTGGPYLRETVDLKLKYSYPFASFIVVLIAIPFASNPRRGGVAVSFAVGALIALTYFVLFRVMQAAGYNEKVPIEMAVWGVNGLYFLIGLILMLRARK